MDVKETDDIRERGSVENVGILAVEVDPALSGLEVELLSNGRSSVATGGNTVGSEVSLTLGT